MNYIYKQSTVSVSLTTRERGAYIQGSLYTEGAYLWNFTVYIYIYIIYLYIYIHIYIYIYTYIMLNLLYSRKICFSKNGRTTTHKNRVAKNQH